jgi:hypothetical protein
MMTNYYAEMLLALDKAEVNFVVAGGVACVLHGVERLTMDLDLALEMSNENLKNFAEVADSLNLKPRVPVPISFLIDQNNRKMMIEEKNALVFSVVDPLIPMKHIDIFLTADNSYEQLNKECDKIELRGRPIKVASKQQIIDMKLKIHPPRDKDIFDIAELKRLISSQAL